MLKYQPFINTQLMKALYTLRIPANGIGTLELIDIYGYGPLTYKTDHLHFHCNSEHTIDGLQYDMEMHFVHSF
jgi:carbonic anhydrase